VWASGIQDPYQEHVKGGTYTGEPRAQRTLVYRWTRYTCSSRQYDVGPRYPDTVHVGMLINLDTVQYGTRADTDTVQDGTVADTDTAQDGVLVDTDTD
jgi:hypothetical protein